MWSPDEDDEEVALPTKEFTETLVGKTKEEALELVKEQRWRFRVRSIDGKGIMGTADARRDRINVHLENNVVTKATVG